MKESCGWSFSDVRSQAELATDERDYFFAVSGFGGRICGWMPELACAVRM
jgi:hypothetical protein